MGSGWVSLSCIASQAGAAGLALVHTNKGEGPDFGYSARFRSRNAGQCEGPAGPVASTRRCGCGACSQPPPSALNNAT